MIVLHDLRAPVLKRLRALVYLNKMVKRRALVYNDLIKIDSYK